MTALQAALAGRREAEKLMLTTVTITRPAGEPVLNEETGEYETSVVTVYSGKAKVTLRGPSVTDVNAAGQLLAAQKLILSVPVAGTESVADDDTVTVTANPLDSALVGRTFTIAGQQSQTFATARRFEIEGLN